MDGKPTNSYLVLGQVIGVHIQRKFLTPEGFFDTAAAHPIARCGYLGGYAEVTHVFEMRRPANDDVKILETIQKLKEDKQEINESP